ncbi:FxLYD domain-containing protein, partial [Heyndrickxia sporothermodurans]|uniref:FxLYD domain-containing protein n=3 Tax=Heyndrickxia sporothermodurans TaxID=46224 RepID=UPI00363211F4
IKLLGEIGENKINSYEVSDIDLMEDDKINMEVMYDEDGKYNPQTVSFGDSLSVSSNSSSNSTPALTLEETGCTKNYGLLKTTGFIKNNSSTSYTFVKIKVTYKDEIGNIIDTDWGYAVDSEPLYPNERKSYEILTKDNEQIKKCHQKITNEY